MSGAVSWVESTYNNLHVATVRACNHLENSSSHRIIKRALVWLVLQWSFIKTRDFVHQPADRNWHRGINMHFICRGGLTVYRTQIKRTAFANGAATLDIGGPVHDYAQVWSHCILCHRLWLYKSWYVTLCMLSLRYIQCKRRIMILISLDMIKEKPLEVEGQAVCFKLDSKLP